MDAVTLTQLRYPSGSLAPWYRVTCHGCDLSLWMAHRPLALQMQSLHRCNEPKNTMLAKKYARETLPMFLEPDLGQLSLFG